MLFFKKNVSPSSDALFDPKVFQCAESTLEEIEQTSEALNHISQKFSPSCCCYISRQSGIDKVSSAVNLSCFPLYNHLSCDFNGQILGQIVDTFCSVILVIYQTIVLRPPFQFCFFE